MPVKGRPTSLVHGLLIVVLALLSVLAAVPLTTQARPGCVATKFADPDEPTRWLESCGRVDPRGDPEQVARQVIAEQIGKLSLSADSSNLSLLAVQKSPTVTHVRFSQLHKGVPVYLGQILVQYDASGVVQLINNHTRPNLNVDVTPKIDADTAQTLALAEVPGSSQLRAPIQQELVIYGEGEQPELAWHLVLYTWKPLGDWHVMIAADDGAVLGAWDEIWYATGSGQVYNPNPVQGSGAIPLFDNNDSTSAALNAARVTLTLNNLADDTNQLRGTYVDLTGTGVVGCNLPYTPGQANEPSRLYNYTRDDDRFKGNPGPYPPLRLVLAGLLCPAVAISGMDGTKNQRLRWVGCCQPQPGYGQQSRLGPDRGHLAALRLSSARFLQQLVAESPDISLTQAEAIAGIGGERTVLPVDGVEGRLKIRLLDTEQSPYERC